MANLRKFIWAGAQNGMKFDLYDHRTRIKLPWSSAEIIEIQPLLVRVKGSAKFLGFEVKGEIEIIMPNEDPTGICTVILNGDRRDNVPYFTQGITLVIRDPRTKIEMDTERKYTWVAVERPISAKIGLWPEGQKMEED